MLQSSLKYISWSLGYPCCKLSAQRREKGIGFNAVRSSWERRNSWKKQKILFREKARRKVTKKDDACPTKRSRVHRWRINAHTRTRTADLMITSHALYQLSHASCDQLIGPALYSLIKQKDNPYLISNQFLKDEIKAQQKCKLLQVYKQCVDI